MQKYSINNSKKTIKIPIYKKDKQYTKPTNKKKPIKFSHLSYLGIHTLPADSKK